MRLIALSLLAAGALALPLAADTGKDSKKTDKERLEGTWKVIGGERDGMKLSDEDVKKLDVTVTIKGDRYSAKANGEDEDGKIKIDPTKKPKTLDFIIESGSDKGKTQLAVYSLEGDKLTICIAAPGGEKRPTELKTAAGSDTSLYTLERQEK
jgi:uncharacterized protein (TIGR03067 family)